MPTVKQVIKHVLSVQTDGGQDLILLFDPSSQTLISSPDRDKQTNKLVSMTIPPSSRMLAFGYVCVKNCDNHKNKLQVFTGFVHKTKEEFMLKPPKKANI